MLEHRIKVFAEKAVNGSSFWSYSTSETIIDKHPQVNYYLGQSFNVSEAIEMLKECRVNPTEAECLKQREIMHAEYEKFKQVGII